MQPEKSKLSGTKPVSQPSVRAKSSMLTRQLLEIPGVEGVGTGRGGRVVVYVSSSGLETSIKKKLQGKDFDIQVTGIISAQ